jgi:hypothetical protein
MRQSACVNQDKSGLSDFSAGGRKGTRCDRKRLWPEAEHAELDA